MPTQEAQADPLKGRVEAIILADIKARGPIFLAIVRQIEAEARRHGLGRGVNVRTRGER